MTKKILSILLMCSFVTQSGAQIVGVQTFDSCLKEVSINGSILAIQKGDILNTDAQAIVNAANEQLLGGAGVCGAIFKAAGWDKLQEACDRYPETSSIRCPVGQACITDSFDLKKLDKKSIEYIIHAVGPDCRIIKDEKLQDILLENAYINSLILADQNNIKSIAFPFISSAIYAFPKERACKIALSAVSNYIKNNNKQIEKISFVLFSQDDHGIFCEVLKNYFLN